MSGVATLKVRGAKRHFDEMAVDMPLPPQACSPARYVIRQPPLKRGRCNPSSAAAASAAARTKSAATAPAPALPHASAPSSQHAAPAPPPSLSDEELAALAKHAPKRLKRVVDKLATGELSLVDKTFSVVDLGEILTSLLAEREAKLNEDFANILNERLAEQFQAFSKYQEDCITRQRRGKDYGYLS